VHRRRPGPDLPRGAQLSRPIPHVQHKETREIAREVRVRHVIRAIPVLCLALLAGCPSNNSTPPPPPPQGCVLPVSTSSLPSGQVIDLGTHRVGDQVNFDVPANTGSITILHQAQAAGLTVVSGGQVLPNEAVPSTITMPGGQTAFDINQASVDSNPDGG